jgi:transposase
MAKRQRRSFDAEFKAEAVRLCKVGDRTVRQVSKDLDLTETALREWVRRADIDAGKGPVGALTTAEREELTLLRRENKRLHMEREILKKAAGPTAALRVRIPDALGHRFRRDLGTNSGGTWAPIPEHLGKDNSRA